MAKNLKEHNFFGFDATVVADSKGLFDTRLTTMVVTFPRYLLAEFNTHRMFSRNSASSRAIPFKKMVERVREHPFIPVLWQKDHPGMQGTEYWTNETHEYKGGTESMIGFFEQEWLYSVDNACAQAEILNKNGVTKQIANRLLEPFMWHTCIVSATEWENFFALRCPQYETGMLGVHRSWKDLMKAEREAYEGAVGYAYSEKDSLIERFRINKSLAEVHIQLAAEAMWDAYNKSEAEQLKPGEWHLPFASDIDEAHIVNYFQSQGVRGNYWSDENIAEVLRQIAVATCARISYGNIDPSTSDIDKDRQLYARLKESLHASPFEHVAQVMTDEEYFSFVKGFGDYYEGRHSFDNRAFGWCNNYRGFVSERHLIGL
jgi:thymidylate synthase ThyX